MELRHYMLLNFIQDPRTKALERNIFKESVQNSYESETNAALNSACVCKLTPSLELEMFRSDSHKEVCNQFLYWSSSHMKHLHRNRTNLIKYLLCLCFSTFRESHSLFFRHLTRPAGERVAYGGRVHTFIVPSTNDLGSVPMNDHL